MARRLQWKPPEGVRVVAEYWLQSNDLAVVAIVESDSVTPRMVATAARADLFDITVVAAITVEERTQLAKQITGR